MQKSVTCIYRERNLSEVVRTIRGRYEDLDECGNIFKLRGIQMMIPGRDEEEELSGYQVVVEDFGCLSEDNLSAFLEAQLPLLILGVKDWELKHAEQVLEMVTEYKEIVYLFNYLDGGQFRQAIKYMDQRNCFRIPYGPDPYAKPVAGAELEFLEELVGVGMERKQK